MSLLSSIVNVDSRPSARIRRTSRHLDVSVAKRVVENQIFAQSGEISAKIVANFCKSGCDLQMMRGSSQLPRVTQVWARKSPVTWTMKRNS